jgi:serine protease Do
LVCGILILAAVIGSGNAGVPFERDVENEASVGGKTPSNIGDANTENASRVEDGYLTKAEIYAKNIDGIVSISSETEKGTGIGSGFFVSRDGYVATAAHVVENARKVWVILSSGKRLEARVVDENEFSDVALLKVDGEDHKALDFGSASALSVGDTVTAIGTPASLEYAGSLSSGEVSYNNRILKVYDGGGALTKKMKVIQTNAEVNPGNSGCPLFNSKGEVVGMVSMKLGRDYEGLGFALPAEGVKRIIEAMASGEELDFDILEGVAIPVPRIGISGTEYSLGDLRGVEIKGFANENEGAVKVLREGDIMTEIDGQRVESISQVSEVIGKYRPRDSVAVTVYRKGQYLTFSVTLY